MTSAAVVVAFMISSTTESDPLSPCFYAALGVLQRGISISVTSAKVVVAFIFSSMAESDAFSFSVCAVLGALALYTMQLLRLCWKSVNTRGSKSVSTRKSCKKNPELGRTVWVSRGVSIVSAAVVVAFIVSSTTESDASGHIAAFRSGISISVTSAKVVVAFIFSSMAESEAFSFSVYAILGVLALWILQLCRDWEIESRPLRARKPRVRREREALLTLAKYFHRPDWGNNFNGWSYLDKDTEGRVIALRLPAKELFGELPEALRKLRHLKKLDLSGNWLRGVIPEWLGELQDLEELYLNDNYFEGKLPEALRNLRHLQKLGLSMNQLEGELPEALRNLRRLQKLVLSTSTPSSKLEDVIPEWLGELQDLEELYFHGNCSYSYFQGEFPEALRNLRHLKKLALSGNQLEGVVPEWLGELQDLEELYLNNNSFRVFSEETAARLFELKSLSKMNTSRNPWEEPPPAVVEAGLEAIIRYYEAIERSGVQKSWMIKVVLVGAVCAGKSSVVASLTARQPRQVPLAQRTRGVDVHVQKPFRPGGSMAKLVFWDFAGHDDYYSTHSLFLSDGALLLLVVDLARFVDDPASRSNAVHIWLDALLCRTPGAVVQIIATHTDELGGEHDVETVVNELRQVVAAHLKAKCGEYERGWKSGGRTEEMPAPPTLRVVYQIHTVSCKTGANWPELGRAIGDLAGHGTAQSLSHRSIASDKALGEEDRLFPSVGQKVPTTWARAAAVMDALREGADPAIAAQLKATTPLHGGTRIRFLSWEDAVRVWGDIVEKSDFLDEIGAGGAKEVLEDAVRLKQSEGMFLLENGLLHLDPTWINELLRAILDHRLQDPAESAFWQGKLEAFADGPPRLDFNQLANTHQTFCTTGTLTKSYLRFLWREVKDIDHDGLFERLLETMLKHGVMFSGLGPGFSDGSIAVDGGRCEALFVPVRLPPYVCAEQLSEFSASCVRNKWRWQLTVSIGQSYIPPGIIGMFMARLFNIEHIHFRCAWGRGVSFMMGGNEVLLYLNAPGLGKAEIEVNVVGPKPKGALFVPVHGMEHVVVSPQVREMEDAIMTLQKEKFPGLRFSRKMLKSIGGEDALMQRIDTLEAHLDVSLDEMVGKLDEVAASNRQSLVFLKSLHGANFPYPHLFVVREHKSRSGGNTIGGRKEVLSKGLFKSFCTGVQTFGKKEMRLQFLCPYDFSPVPCGPDGGGYVFEEARGWVFPAVKVTALMAKAALKAVSKLVLPVDEFLTAVMEEVIDEVADRAFDEDTLRRAILGEEDASADMRGTSKASYDALVKFMDKNGYDDFKNEMQLVPDGQGQGGTVWVTNANVGRWKRLWQK
eukprot:g18779.t2